MNDIPLVLAGSKELLDSVTADSLLAALLGSTEVSNEAFPDSVEVVHSHAVDKRQLHAFRRHIVLERIENIIDQSSFAAARRARDVEDRVNIVRGLGRLGGEEGCDEVAEGGGLGGPAGHVASTVACRAQESTSADVDRLRDLGRRGSCLDGHEGRGGRRVARGGDARLGA